MPHDLVGATPCHVPHHVMRHTMSCATRCVLPCFLVFMCEPCGAPTQALWCKDKYCGERRRRLTRQASCLTEITKALGMRIPLPLCVCGGERLCGSEVPRAAARQGARHLWSRRAPLAARQSPGARGGPKSPHAHGIGPEQGRIIPPFFKFLTQLFFNFFFFEKSQVEPPHTREAQKSKVRVQPAQLKHDQKALKPIFV